MDRIYNANLFYLCSVANPHQRTDITWSRTSQLSELSQPLAPDGKMGTSILTTDLQLICIHFLRLICSLFAQQTETGCLLIDSYSCFQLLWFSVQVSQFFLLLSGTLMQWVRTDVCQARYVRYPNGIYGALWFLNKDLWNKKEKTSCMYVCVYIYTYIYTITHVICLF